MSYWLLETGGWLILIRKKNLHQKLISNSKLPVVSYKLPAANRYEMVKPNQLNSNHRLFLHPTFIAIRQTNIHPVTKLVSQLNGNSFVNNE